MSARRSALVVLPGRGTYNKSELGTLFSLHPDRTALFDSFDAIRAARGQETLRALDGAASYSVAQHTRGDNASALIYAASLADHLAIDRERFDVVAVTGNSMGWYTTLAAGGAVTAQDGFTIANTMGTLMQESLIGGQTVYPVVDENWRPDPQKRAAVEAALRAIDGQDGMVLKLSIRLGGMLVLAGNKAGIEAFEARVPTVDGRFPLRLSNHAAFHTALQEPVAEKGRALLPHGLFSSPQIPIIDGRGAIWWPGSCDTAALRTYTLGQQVCDSYDFSRAVMTSLREFNPDHVIITGPGTTLGGAVAQAMIAANWRGLASKGDFQAAQAGEMPLMLSMGMADQRARVTIG